MNHSDRPEYREEDYENNAERAEREGVQYGVVTVVPDSDWEWYLEATYVDPAERDYPCCGDPMCPCGGYTGNYHGPSNY